MRIRQLTLEQKEKLIGGFIIFVGLSVLVGQISETRASFFYSLLSDWRQYIDPLQYMTGMLLINLILVFTVITRNKTHPNPILNYLKWYFTILFVCDFVILVFRVIQQSNIIVYKSGIATGLGKTYLLLATTRGMLELTMISAATLLLVRGLSIYRPDAASPDLESPLNAAIQWRKIITGVVVFQWLFFIPVNFGVLLQSRSLFAWSLGLGQTGQLVIAALMYWLVKEYHRKYGIKFFQYLTWHYGLGLFVAGLVFTYSMGSFGLLQRFPAGEAEMPGGFGQLVFYISRFSYVVSNYLMFRAITSYDEGRWAAGHQVPGAGIYLNE